MGDERGFAMELLSGVILRALETYESEHGSAPTAAELAADLGIPPEFGHHHLVERLQRQVVLGRVTNYGLRYQLTAAGREALAWEAARSAGWS